MLGRGYIHDGGLSEERDRDGLPSTTDSRAAKYWARAGASRYAALGEKTVKLSDLLQSTVRVEPLLVRPDQAALILGSVELVDDLLAAGWLRPVISRKRLTLYSLVDLQGCVARLQAGECLEGSSSRAPVVQG